MKFIHSFNDYMRDYSWKQLIGGAACAVVCAGIAYHRMTIKGLQRQVRPAGIEISVDDKGHSVFLTTRGDLTTAENVVVFVHGSGGSSFEFKNIVEEVQNSAATCCIDRVLNCHGNLDPSRTFEMMAKEMHVALQKMNITRPCVFVAHSMGGMICLAYATLYTSSVKALVLVDPAHPDQPKRLPKDFAEALRRAPRHSMINRVLAPLGIVRLKKKLRLPPTGLLAPDDARAVHLLMSSSRVWKAAGQEMYTFRDHSAEFKQNLEKHGHNLQQIPITIITATNRIFSPTAFPEEATETFKSMHREYLSYTSKGFHVFAHESDHWAHLQQPELVSSAILEHLQ